MAEPAPHRRLVILRHGRTAWNLAGRAQGHTDIPLDEVGHAQAAGAARTLASYRPVRIWSSDLTRALQTAQPLAEATGLPIEQDPRLREYDVGERAGLTDAEFESRWPDAYASWVADDDRAHAPGEQTRTDLDAQLRPALQEYVASLGPGELGVAVLHGASAKVGLAGLLGWPLDVVPTLRGLDNARWAIVEERLRDGRLRLLGYNLSAPPDPRRADFASDGAVG